MAQEDKTPATCTVLGQLSAFRSSDPIQCQLKVSSRYRPTAIGREGSSLQTTTVRYK
jgi:hypothetical protein